MVTIKGELGSGLSTQVKKIEPKTYVVQKVIGNDTYLVKAQSQIELEDEFSSLYYTAQNQSNIFLMPPFEPNALLRLVLNNNILSQCIEAMEVNIDGTGYEFVPTEEGEKIDPDELKVATSFFKEPYPNESWITIRRKLRRQRESIGYAYLEILRNMAGDLVGVRNVETHHVRMVKLDEPIMVSKSIERNGKDIEMQLWVRERRFAQRVALKVLVYYREFGATRNVDRNNGKWETDDVKIPASDQGTELLMFGNVPDIHSPYFVPRWVNQMPSVVGSRKAEEQNLEFLDSGGMPPAIIFVQGGVLAKDAADQLRMYLSGQNKNKYRAVVVEAQSSSGSLDSSGVVKVSVERFGSEKANDAMYMNYDKVTENHVRVGFRLPPLFLGRNEDYNFATAQVAYMVAEAQVFNPERMEFDEAINMTLIKEMGLKTLKIKSLPITLQDVSNQLKAMEQVKDISEPKSFLDETNKITGLELELNPNPVPDTVTATVNEQGQQVMGSGRTVTGQPPVPQMQPPQPPPERGSFPAPPKPSAQPQNGKQKQPTPINAKQKKKAIELIDLAHDYAVMRGVMPGEMTPERQLILKEEIEGLDDEEREGFLQLASQYAYGVQNKDFIRILQEVV